VTDDQGRYLVPDLPQADYSVWVRGYGLVDSPKMRAKPGQRLDLAAAPAMSEADAAHYYPAIYWYSLLTIPEKKEFGGENGIPANVTQQDWLTIIKNRACVGLSSASTGAAPCTFDAGEIRAALFEGAEERLSRCVSDRRGGAAPDDEIRRHQDGRPTRLAGAAPGAGAAGEPAHRHHQSDPCVSVGARGCRAPRAAFPARRAADHSHHPL
jgi:hypothetical protein